ncbi:flagellar hook-associated protein 1 FlgK [Actinoplanes tereljensis]|uniref:Flagellar hook-associated protein 1 n=1 Tax=Paractinoplanes tereljensis TaxID=571912 RepID=A0A919NSF0_9ACTN|nr:flagellar hook-associated protein FlgK [Actinoplanes tereljensis]GIF24250.1 flagellar hook-associated protein FlgK [Actinoplanes tereljensis]
MASTFGGINTALSSLYAQRRGLDITGQNIANANTEGYTRQRIRMQSQTGSLNPGIYSTTDQVGNGVTVAAIERGRNQYLEDRGRTEHASSAYLTNTKATYDQVESVLAEPSDTALQARLHDMWDGWNDVANNWQDPSTRSSLIERSKTVTTTLNDAYTSISHHFDDQHNQIDAYVTQVNTMASGIADMNNQIAIAQKAGLPANELQDERDRQVMQLSELSGASAILKDDGSANVYVGNVGLVEGFNARELELTGPGTLDEVMSSGDKVALKWSGTDSPVTAGGTMGAMLDSMNNLLTGIVSDLDSVAKGIADTVNTAMAGGYTIDGKPGDGSDPGVPQFFEGTTAAKIKVALTDASQVAFSQGNPDMTGPDPSLDHYVADKLSGMGIDPTGPDATYQSMIGRLGVSAQATARRSEIQDSVKDQVDSARQGESGVNLDEEMTHLLTYQRGYEAASRVLTTIDSMLDQLINRTGMVGR